MSHLITWFLLFFISLNAISGAPLGVVGAGQTTKLYPSVVKTPNSQVTNLGAGSALLETGNQNILSNPSLEHQTFSTSWSISGCSWVVETTVVIHGSKSGKITCTAQTLSLTQDSTSYQAQYADGVQGLQLGRFKTAISGFFMCARSAGTTNLNLCVPISGSSKWGNPYKIPVILGATSNGFAVVSGTQAVVNGPVVVGNVTGDLYVDDLNLGAGDLKQDINIITEWQSYTPTFNGLGTVTNINAHWRQVGSNIEIMFRGTTGTVSASVAYVTLPNSWTVASGVATAEKVVGSAAQNAASAGTPITVLVSSGNQYVNFGNASASGTTKITSGTGTAVFISSSDFSFQATVPVAQLAGATTAFTASNADTDWAACSFSTLAWQSFGTVTSSLMCKRQGGDLLISGKFVSGTAAAAAPQIPLPLWNGSQLVVAGTSRVPAIQPIGAFYRGNAGSSVIKDYDLLITPSTNYIAVSTPEFAGTQNPFTAFTTNVLATGETASVEARIPIEGWTQSNVMVASILDYVSSSGAGKPDVQSVYFASGTACTTGTCTSNNLVGSKITSVTWAATGCYNLNGIDGTKYNCSANASATGNSYSMGTHFRASSTSSLAKICFGSGVATNVDVLNASVTCIGVP